MTALAHRIQHAARLMAAQDCESVAVPPFVAYIEHTTGLPFFSWAVPEDGARAPWDQRAIAETAAAFAAANRQPRFEFVESCWPGLVDALTANGFALEHRLPGMICKPSALAVPASPIDVSIERVGRDADSAAIADLLRVKWAPFDEMEAVPPADEAAIERFRSSGIESVVARAADGTAIGSAGWMPPQEAVSEIVAVGVLGKFRRRGIATALTVSAGRCAELQGAGLLYITPDNVDAGRVYERAGFAFAEDCSLVKLAITAKQA